MSTRYPGGVITKTPVVPAGPYESGAAPGIWTLDQQLQAAKAGIWPLAGNPVPYIEDVFSTYLYTGNGSTQTITTGVDTGTKGGLIWVKKRSAADDHALFDSVRASGSILSSNLTDAATAGGSRLALTSTGFDLQAGGGTYNQNGFTYASWTFREQPKFFDVVTYTGAGNPNASRQISHNLGSVPGFILVKATSTTSDWYVCARTSATTYATILSLNSTAAAGFNGVLGAPPTSTYFDTTGIIDATAQNYPNQTGVTYVAYLFAHNAGGFGLTGTDNVISCGSYTNDAGGNPTTVNLGYEPQMVIFKRTDSSTFGNWYMIDNMRGFIDPSGSSWLWANATNAEQTGINFAPTATGFTTSFVSSATFIYIAIRRGPMKVPTDATKVFTPTKNATPIGYPADSFIYMSQTGYSPAPQWASRLQGGLNLVTSNTDAEMNGFWSSNWKSNSTAGVGGGDAVGQMFRRAPGFFDEVCYTGTGANTTQTHNLGVVPELIIAKQRSGAGGWNAYSSGLGATKNIILNSTAAATTNSAFWNNTQPTSSVFSIGTASSINASAQTYIAYLFATVAGVSKVGSYTGNGTTQTIDCGFGAGGVRFVLIKRTDSTGDWYVYDTARGMTVLTDPYLLLNDTAAEVATLGSVTTVSTGFALNSTILAAINVNAGTYIFLAIA